jgi:hypothetical protein
MANKNTDGRKRKSAGDFHILNGPMVDTAAKAFGLEVDQLPRIYDSPLLFAIPRDPHTIFAYWNVNWAVVFGGDLPEDRQVHLRVVQRDGSEEISTAVEPMAGSICIQVSPERGPYRLEIGYHVSGHVWRLVAVSDRIAMPSESISEDTDVDLATIPYHLSFQRLRELFGLSKDEALAVIVGQEQARIAGGETDVLLSDEERNILSEMKISRDQLRLALRDFAPKEESRSSRKRTDAILGLGSTSPARPFGCRS